MTQPIFVLFGTPGALPVGEDAAAPTVRWEDICHGQKGREFIFINHETGRSPSRWTFAENKRPFIVYRRSGRSISRGRLGASSTLAGALKIAARWAA